ncbi:MAG: T9SS type A sorting domain-containing protein, partial [Saprospiraceae bacterium]|nr:T9SS type A sorting domain-containing protein [Saprospiraceae bacterium]
PYTYNWSTGEAGAMISDLSPGDYTVNVFDSRGCQQTLALTVDVGTAVEEIESLDELKLAPNPTTGISLLSASFTRPVDIELGLFNLHGQQLSRRSYNRTSVLNHPVDLSNLPRGIYLIRLLVDGQINTLRLVKAN